MRDPMRVASVGAVIGACAVFATAQTPSLVADLVTTPPSEFPSSGPRSPVVMPNGDILFAVENSEFAEGVLFRTDGTAAGTRLVDTTRTIRAVPPAFDREMWSRGGGPLCFVNDRNEVWTTDGTGRGTIYLGPASQGSGSILLAPRGYPSIVTVPSGRVFWLSSNGLTLITSDGATWGGATTVFTSAAGSVLDFIAANMAPLGNRVIFAARSSSATGFEPFISDGTPGGTVALGDLFPGAASSRPRWFVPFNGRVYFVATDASGTELWSTDGTPEGTQRYADLNPGPVSSNPEMLTVSEGRLWFTAIPPGRSRTIWHTDGSEESPVAMPSFFAGSLADGVHRPVPFAGGVVHTLSGQGATVHLIRTTGVTRLTPSSIGHSNAESGPLVVPGNGTIPDRVFFTGMRNDRSTGDELYAATAEPNSAAIVADLQPGFSASSIARPLASLGNGRLLFSATVNGDRELYISDGTSVGTTLLVDLGISHRNANPSIVIEGDFPEQAVFSADSTEWGAELFATDGTRAGTQPVVEFTPGTAGRRRSIYKSDNGWFSVYPIGTTADAEIWFHDFLNDIGRSLGTVSNYVSTNILSLPGVAVGDTLVFSARDPGSISPPVNTAWSASGSLGISPLIPVQSGGPVVGAGYVRFGDWIYFGADGRSDNKTQQQLYRTDGTSQGTTLLWDAGFASNIASSPFVLGAVNNAIIIGINRNVNQGIYVHTPASGNTAPLLRNMEIYGSSATSRSTIANEVLYFSASSIFGSDAELWRTDGTIAGTYRVRDIQPGGDGSFPEWFSTLQTAAGPRIFFSARTPAHGRELWTSDGTETGTRMVIDLFPGPRGASPTLTFATGTTKVYFAADDGLTGNELWETDGTEAGTRQVADINPGPESSSPTNFSVVDGKLWFSATTRAHGRELYVMPLTPPGAACDYDYNQDQHVNLTDAQQMAQVAAGVILADPIWLDGDLNGDENADLTDAQILAAYVTSGVCGV